MRTRAGNQRCNFVCNGFSFSKDLNNLARIFLT
jgi:hypothetical protein